MEYNIKLSQQTIQTIMQGLGELPLKVSINAFMEIQQKFVVASAPTPPADNPPEETPPKDAGTGTGQEEIKP